MQKKWNWTIILHHIYKLTQNELKTWSLRPEAIKLLKKTKNKKQKKTKTVGKFLNISLCDFFWIKNKSNKSRNKQVGLHQTKKAPAQQRKPSTRWKATYQMGEIANHILRG